MLILFYVYMYLGIVLIDYHMVCYYFKIDHPFSVSHHSEKDPALFHTVQENPARPCMEIFICLFMFSLVFVTLSVCHETVSIYFVTLVGTCFHPTY